MVRYAQMLANSGRVTAAMRYLTIIKPSSTEVVGSIPGDGIFLIRQSVSTARASECCIGHFEGP